MAEFHKTIPASQLPAGQCTEVVVAGKPVALYNVDGRFYATGNVCLHRGGPLGQGMLDGAVVMCPWHAWCWDVTTGANTANADLKVPCYPVKLEEGHLFVAVD